MDPPPGLQSFYCQLCRVPCSGVENYKQHMDGMKHMKNQRRQGMISSVPFATASTNGAAGTALTDAATRTAPTDGATGSAPTDGATGSAPTDGAIGTAPTDGATGTAPTSVTADVQLPTSGGYYCSVCMVSMTGPESYSAHMVGQKHVKKVNQLKMLKDFRTEPSSATPQPPPSDSSCLTEGIQSIPSTSTSRTQTDTEESIKKAAVINGNCLENRGNQQFWCRVCRIQISGEENSQLHVHGTAHFQKMKKEKNIVVDAPVPREEPTKVEGEETPKFDKDCQACVQPEIVNEEPALSDDCHRGLMLINCQNDATPLLRDIYSVTDKESREHDEDAFCFKELLEVSNNMKNVKEVVNAEMEEAPLDDENVLEDACNDDLDQNGDTEDLGLHGDNQNILQEDETAANNLEVTGAVGEDKIDDTSKLAVKRKKKGIAKLVNAVKHIGKKKKSGQKDSDGDKEKPDVYYTRED